jgi:hypothetical protein
LACPFALSDAAISEVVNDNGEDVIENNADRVNIVKKNALKMFIVKRLTEVYFNFSKPLSSLNFMKRFDASALYAKNYGQLVEFLLLTLEIP